MTLVTGTAWAAPSTLRKGPYLQDLGPESVTVRLELDPPLATGRVEIELTGPDDKSRRIASPGDPKAPFHVIAIGGLTPRTAYKYRVIFSGGVREEPAADGAGAFTTAPNPGDTAPIRFVVYGDNRSDDAAHAGVVRAVAAAPTDFLLHTGDFVEDGANELQWQRFFEIERSLLRNKAIFSAVGNHELTQPTGENYLRFFGDPAMASATQADRRRFYRTVRWGNVRVFFLNGMDTFTSAEERKWLEAELEKSAAESGVTFRFAVLHHGPYASGPHGPNARLWNSGMVDVLRQQRIDMVWSGHDHIYERGEAKGLKYLVSGGGGAPLYPIKKKQPSTRMVESAHHFVEVKIDGQELSLLAKRVDGSILDRCGFAKGGPWNCDKTPAEAATSTPTPTPTPATPPASRCGCVVVGSPSPSLPPHGYAALGALAGLLLARRRGSG